MVRLAQLQLRREPEINLQFSLAGVQHCAHKQGRAGGIIHQHQQEGPAGHNKEKAHSSNDLSLCHVQTKVLTYVFLGCPPDAEELAPQHRIS
jgi:hypothetical protein